MKKIKKTKKINNEVEAYLDYSHCGCDDVAYTNCLYNTLNMILFDGAGKHTSNNYQK